MISVTELLVKEGFINTAWFDEYSRTRGSYVHKAIHLWDIGQLDESTVDPVIEPYLEAWKKFLVESKFEVIDSEVRLYSEIHQFTGMPDKVGLLNNKPTIADAKSGGIEPWVALQLAGYEILKGNSYKRIAIRLQPDGKYNLKEFTNRYDRQIFLSALSCYHWKQNNLKGKE